MRIIIEGAGEVGSHLAKMLRAEANDVTVIDDDPRRLEQLTLNADIEAVSGNPSSIKVLQEAGVEKADLLIAVYPFVRQEVNIMGAILAKQLGAGKVIARVDEEEYLTAENRLIFKELGIELMFYPEKSAADETIDLLKNSFATDSIEFERGKLQVAMLRLEENSPLLDLKMSEFSETLTAQENELFRVIALCREGKTIFPKADSKFMYGDMVVTISREDSAASFSERFGISNVAVRNVMIVGGNEVARMTAAALARQGINVKIIENDKARCIQLIEQLPETVSVVCGDGRNSDFLFEESISAMDAFIALTGSDETNVLACIVARKFGVTRTLAEVENIEYMHLAEEMGVVSINKKLITAGRIFKFTLSGKARFVKQLGLTDAEVIEYTAAPGSSITKGSLKDINFPEDARVCGIIRGSEAFLANSDTQVEAYDKVIVFTLPHSLSRIDRFFK